jgi:RND family efflux transporter MFP subunit
MKMAQPPRDTVRVAAPLCATLALLTAFTTGAARAHGPEGDHGDHGDHGAPAASPAVDALARLPDGSVNVPKLAQRRMGLRTERLSETDAELTVALPARVVADPNASGQLQSLHGGRIEPGPQGLPVPGQTVKAGEVLAWVRHHAEPYARAEQESRQAELQAQAELARQRLARLEQLEGTVARKDLEAARIEAEALAKRARSLTLSLSAREALTAPVSGVVARADLRVGQVVEPQQVVIEVVNPQRLLVEATTPDAALAAQVRGAHLQGVPGARLQWLGAARALRDGVLPLNFRLQTGADSPALAVGQSLTLLATLQGQRKGLVLPASAVVRSPANEAVVWVKTGVQTYAPKPVQVQALNAQQVLVTAGLAPGQRAVVQGASLLAQIR